MVRLGGWGNGYVEDTSATGWSVHHSSGGSFVCGHEPLHGLPLHDTEG